MMLGESRANALNEQKRLFDVTDVYCHERNSEFIRWNVIGTVFWAVGTWVVPYYVSTPPWYTWAVLGTSMGLCLISGAIALWRMHQRTEECDLYDWLSKLSEARFESFVKHKIN